MKKLAMLALFYFVTNFTGTTKLSRSIKRLIKYKYEVADIEDNNIYLNKKDSKSVKITYQKNQNKLLEDYNSDTRNPSSIGLIINLLAQQGYNILSAENNKVVFGTNNSEETFTLKKNT